MEDAETPKVRAQGSSWLVSLVVRKVLGRFGAGLRKIVGGMAATSATWGL